jgi:hypothetical protein
MGRVFLFDFCFGTVCGASMATEANGTAMSFSLGRWYGPVLSLSLLEDYDKASRYFEASIRNMAPISPVLASMVDRALKYGSQRQGFKSYCSPQRENGKYYFFNLLLLER